jgi:hypothetical protein
VDRWARVSGSRPWLSIGAICRRSRRWDAPPANPTRCKPNWNCPGRFAGDGIRDSSFRPWPVTVQGRTDVAGSRRWAARGAQAAGLGPVGRVTEIAGRGKRTKGKLHDEPVDDGLTADPGRRGSPDLGDLHRPNREPLPADGRPGRPHGAAPGTAITITRKSPN